MSIFSKKNKQEPQYVDKRNYSEYVGSICKVTTEKDSILFIGNVTDYNIDKGEITVADHRAEPISGVMYDTPVKINIQKTSGVIIFYGNVRRQTEDFWRVEIVNAYKHEEQRGSFRQLLKCKARIMSYGVVPSKNVNDTCIIHDISITGLSFISEYDFDVGDEVFIYGAVINKEMNANYDFQCTIIRIFKGENNEKCYGCTFKKMKPEVEKELIRDIFYLQKEAMKHN